MTLTFAALKGGSLRLAVGRAVGRQHDPLLWAALVVLRVGAWALPNTGCS
jgi:hypothetical protein